MNKPLSYKGIVVIAHGMMEHAGRYAEFSRFLDDAGYHVYGKNHRGHGPGAKLGQIDGGWDDLVNDLKAVIDSAKKEHPGLPVFLFGHSMGSFLAQDVALRWGKELKGIILSGSSFQNRLSTGFGMLATKFLSEKVIHSIVFGGFNKAFRPNRTDYDWLSRDEKEVDNYIADPLCGFVCSRAFFYALFSGLFHLYGHCDRMPKNLPILFISGAKDPLGQSVPKLIRIYQSCGVTDIQSHFYPDGRHESLNEINRRQVYSNILDWLSSHI